MGPLLLLALLPLICASQLPFQRPSEGTLIPSGIDAYIASQLAHWNSSGLAVAVVRKDESGWNTEFASYGKAQAGGAPVTPDTVFAIASDSKLFLAMGVGLLIKNESLAAERGEKLRWDTKIASLLPEWGLMDEEMQNGVTIQDMLSHRTGMPRHDYSGFARHGGVSEMISTLRFLRPSAALREQYQYNNLMYETLSHLQPTLLNQSFESYIASHLFAPLGMNASTYSVAEAEARGTLAHGFHWSMKDALAGRNGTLTATVPYFQRPGEERVWAGAAGILSSARDLSVWVAMLLNDGRHPTTNATVVPADVVEHVALGASVSLNKAEYPETSPKVYGCGQNRFSYRGHEIVEHGGSNPGFKTIVSRLPHENIGIIVLSNDDDGVRVFEPVKFRILDALLGLEPIDWAQRYVDSIAKGIRDNQAVTPRPAPSVPSTTPFAAMEGAFAHPAYGTFSPCYASASPSPACTATLAHPVARAILAASSPNDVPTLIAPFKRTFATHLRLAHFAGNVFNASVVWSNADVRRAEGHKEAGDVLVGLDNRFVVEWVPSGGENGADGWAFGSDFWGKDGEVRALEGTGETGAEVWFGRV
ncbi:beta-lactamase/transpeptidase-like protein [Mycena rosella]|uniref:Beta-lactamase/transpeptidase-like protein n=1 Tax=Mycena rosella TaxID=1033263 RepID=A0AAD7D6E6_MYCRO|nr:beta-lactamase/transpeptidase-like protein [Mycena rosella]